MRASAVFSRFAVSAAGQSLASERWSIGATSSLVALISGSRGGTFEEGLQVLFFCERTVFPFTGYLFVALVLGADAKH